MATKDPWAAFNPQAEGAVAPLIPRTPAPQTGPQAQADVLANQKTEAEIRTANATANITEHKASEEATIDQKQQAAKLSAIESADQLIGAVKRARSLVSGWSTGVGGAILDHIPATQAAQLDTIVNQEIRGNIFLNRINALKEENPSPDRRNRNRPYHAGGNSADYRIDRRAGPGENGPQGDARQP
jgi:hypothetical protein